MKTARKRLSSLVSFIFNPTLVLLLAIFLSSFLVVKKPPAADLRVLEYKSYGRNMVVSFEPNVDLSTQFNFNLKQVFVYLRATYPDMENGSEIVWSRIVRRGDEKRLSGVFRSNYDIAGDLSRRAVFELRGNYFPFVGIVRDVLFCRKEVSID